MSLFERTSRVIRANMNSSKSNYEAVADAQQSLLRMRQAVALAVNAKKQIQTQVDKAKADVDLWQRRAQLALNEGREDTARQALTIKRNHCLSLIRLEKQIEEHSIHLSRLQAQLASAEVTTTEFASSVSYSTRSLLQESIGTLGTSSAMSAFDRMEEKVLQMEASGQAAELAGADLESQFAQLESGGDVDYELEAIKQAMLGGPALGQEALPAGKKTGKVQTAEVKDSAVDAELEALKSELDSL